MGSNVAGDDHLVSGDIDLPPVLRIEQAVYVADAPMSPDERVREHIRQTLVDYGIRVSGKEAAWTVKLAVPEPLPTSEQALIKKYSAWTVKPDNHYDLHNNLIPHLRLAAVEITSPAAWSSPTGFDELLFVLRLLRSRYRIRINPTCGLHVHVGSGHARFPEHPPVVQRLAALVWAADPVIAAIHPPERRANPYSGSIRDGSRLAFRDPYSIPPVSEKTSGLGPRDVFSQDERLSRAALRSLPLPSSTRRPNQRRRFSSRRLRSERTDPGDDAGTARMADFGIGPPVEAPGAAPANQAPFTSALEGARALLACDDAAAVAHLLGHRPLCPGFSRLNYNFNAYRGGGGFRDTGTVEFREAGGSVDPEWVVAWARIAAAMAESAWSTPDREFFLMLMRLAEAQGEFSLGDGEADDSKEEEEVDLLGLKPRPRFTGPVTYDVIDFVDDLGLHAEAELLEERMRDPQGFWHPCVNIKQLLPDEAPQVEEKVLIGRIGGDGER